MGLRFLLDANAKRLEFESYLLVTRVPALVPATLAALPPTRGVAHRRVFPEGRRDDRSQNCAHDVVRKGSLATFQTASRDQRTQIRGQIQKKVAITDRML